MWWVTYRVLELWVPHKVNCPVYLQCYTVLADPSHHVVGHVHSTGYYNCGSHEVNCPVYTLLADPSHQVVGHIQGITVVGPMKWTALFTYPLLADPSHRVVGHIQQVTVVGPMKWTALFTYTLLADPSCVVGHIQQITVVGSMKYRPKPPCGGSHTADYSCGSHEVNCPVYLQIMAYIYIHRCSAGKILW